VLRSDNSLLMIRSDNSLYHTRNFGFLLLKEDFITKSCIDAKPNVLNQTAYILFVQIRF